MSIASNWRTRDQLLRVVRRVRRRWRLKLVLRGLALTLAGTLLTFLISASTLEFLRFEPGAVTAFRVVLWLVVGFFVIRSVLWPLLRRVSDERVALYLERTSRRCSPASWPRSSPRARATSWSGRLCCRRWCLMR